MDDLSLEQSLRARAAPTLPQNLTELVIARAKVTQQRRGFFNLLLPASRKLAEGWSGRFWFAAQLAGACCLLLVLGVIFQIYTPTFHASADEDISQILAAEMDDALDFL